MLLTREASKPQIIHCLIDVSWICKKHIYIFHSEIQDRNSLI